MRSVGLRYRPGNAGRPPDRERTTPAGARAATATPSTRRPKPRDWTSVPTAGTCAPRRAGGRRAAAGSAPRSYAPSRRRRSRTGVGAVRQRRTCLYEERTVHRHSYRVPSDRRFGSTARPRGPETLDGPEGVHPGPAVEGAGGPVAARPVPRRRSLTTWAGSETPELPSPGPPEFRSPGTSASAAVTRGTSGRVRRRTRPPRRSDTLG
jgi:hypothetical protein